MELKIIDLFSGAGGMTEGFIHLSKYQYKSVWANDFNAYAVNTYRKNFGSHCIEGDIVDLLESGINIPNADVVIGGPPCQGFSLLNKNREGDPRKQLWIPYMDIVKESGAQIFVMENVPQILGSDEHQKILKKASELGFKTWSGTLLAADYGVAQLRKRAFIVGAKKADPKKFFPPLKTNYSKEKEPRQIGFGFTGYIANAQPWVSVRDVIGDLPPPLGTEIRNEAPPLDLHFGRMPTEKSIKRYKAIPEEGMNRFDLQRIAPDLTPKCWINKKKGGTDLFGRLWWDKPAFTIRTEFFKPEKGRYLHPKQHRPITHREAARIQSFPDSFVFTGSKIEIAKQIGNAVPPRLAAQIADCVYEIYLSGEQVDSVGYIFGTETSRDYVSCEKQEYLA